MEPINKIITSLVEALKGSAAKRVLAEFDEFNICVTPVSIQKGPVIQTEPVQSGPEADIICPRQQAILDAASRDTPMTAKKLASKVGRAISSCFYRDLRHLQRCTPAKLVRVKGGYKLLIPLWYCLDLLFAVL